MLAAPGRADSPRPEYGAASHQQRLVRASARCNHSLTVAMPADAGRNAVRQWPTWTRGSHDPACAASGACWLVGPPSASRRVSTTTTKDAGHRSESAAASKTVNRHCRSGACFDPSGRPAEGATATMAALDLPESAAAPRAGNRLCRVGGARSALRPRPNRDAPYAFPRNRPPGYTRVTARRKCRALFELRQTTKRTSYSRTRAMESQAAYVARVR